MLLQTKWKAVLDPIIKAVANAPVLPTGSELGYWGTTAPDGYLLEDGSSYLISQYPQLSAVLGSAYAAADGVHFHVPNRQGLYARGAGSQVVNGVTYSAKLGAVQNDATKKNGLALTDPTHTHQLDYEVGVSNTGSSNAYPATSTNNNTGANQFSAVGYAVQPAGTGVTLGSGDSETRPASVAMNFIIKT